MTNTNNTNQTLEQKISKMEKAQDIYAGLELTAGFSIISGLSFIAGVVLSTTAYPQLQAHMNPYLVGLSTAALFALPTALCGLAVKGSEYKSQQLESKIYQIKAEKEQYGK